MCAFRHGPLSHSPIRRRFGSEPTPDRSGAVRAAVAVPNRVILSGEVDFGKTIEAGIVLC
jgi:hypothetical protein